MVLIRSSFNDRNWLITLNRVNLAIIVWLHRLCVEGDHYYLRVVKKGRSWQEERKKPQARRRINKWVARPWLRSSIATSWKHCRASHTLLDKSIKDKHQRWFREHAQAHPQIGTHYPRENTREQSHTSCTHNHTVSWLTIWGVWRRNRRRHKRETSRHIIVASLRSTRNLHLHTYANSC